VLRKKSIKGRDHSGTVSLTNEQKKNKIMTDPLVREVSDGVTELIAIFKAMSDIAADILAQGTDATTLEPETVIADAETTTVIADTPVAEMRANDGHDVASDALTREVDDGTRELVAIYKAISDISAKVLKMNGESNEMPTESTTIAEAEAETTTVIADTPVAEMRANAGHDVASDALAREVDEGARELAAIYKVISDFSAKVLKMNVESNEMLTESTSNLVNELPTEQKTDASTIEILPSSVSEIRDLFHDVMSPDSGLSYDERLDQLSQKMEHLMMLTSECACAENSTNVTYPEFQKLASSLTAAMSNLCAGHPETVERLAELKQRVEDNVDDDDDAIECVGNGIYQPGFRICKDGKLSPATMQDIYGVLTVTRRMVRRLMRKAEKFGVVILPADTKFDDAEHMRMLHEGKYAVREDGKYPMATLRDILNVLTATQMMLKNGRSAEQVEMVGKFYLEGTITRMVDLPEK
jgi:hypothetical protein